MSDGIGLVKTSSGRFSGAANKPMVPGSEAALVVPAEAFTMIPQDRMADGRPDPGTHFTPTIESRDTIGPIIRFLLALEGGRSVTLEGHVERYGRGFETGSTVARLLGRGQGHDHSGRRQSPRVIDILEAMCIGQKGPRAWRKRSCVASASTSMR